MYQSTAHPQAANQILWFYTIQWHTTPSHPAKNLIIYKCIFIHCTLCNILFFVIRHKNRTCIIFNLITINSRTFILFPIQQTAYVLTWIFLIQWQSKIIHLFLVYFTISSNSKFYYIFHLPDKFRSPDSHII